MEMFSSSCFFLFLPLAVKYTIINNSVTKTVLKISIRSWSVIYSK